MSGEISPRVLYNYDTHRNIPWNIVEYQPLQEYHGKQVQRNTENLHVTKKGFYMDEHIKIVKDLPEPGQYPPESIFDQSQNKEKGKRIKINPRLKKGSYLDQIALEGKKSKIGVGSYHLEKTEKQLKEELKSMKKYKRMAKSARPSFYEDMQCLSMVVPGAGNYNPRLEVTHEKKDLMSCQKWRNKHSKQDKETMKKKKKVPGPSSYRPVSAGTFDRVKVEHVKNKKRNSASCGKFGTDARFTYCRPNKKKILEKRPEPTQYETGIIWAGKKDDPRKKRWDSLISTRPHSARPHSASVYH